MSYELDPLEYTAAAYVGKKLNKREAYRVLKDALDGSCELNKAMLARLVRYFEPATPAKSKTVADWLARALAGSGEIRKYLQFIYCDGENLIACDGHRLHVAYGHGAGMALGFYNKQLDLVHGSDWARYPDWARLIPGGKNVRLAGFDVDSFMPSASTKPVFYASFETPEAGRLNVNKAYLEAAQNVPSGLAENLETLATENGRVMVRAGDLTAVVMPLKI